MRVKVCGLKEPENIKEVVQLPVDYIGLIFYKKSPRYVEADPEDLAFMQNFDVKKVGVFVNETEDFILDKIEQYKLDYIQLHGNESAHFCKKIQQLNRKVIKAFNIHNNFNFDELSDYEPFCHYFLFDAYGEKAGGNGITFNWDLLQKYKGETPFLLSGGIGLETLEAINQFEHKRFAGVDINSKFEITPGVKNIEKIKQFTNELFN